MIDDRVASLLDQVEALPAGQGPDPELAQALATVVSELLSDASAKQAGQSIRALLDALLPDSHACRSRRAAARLIGGSLAAAPGTDAHLDQLWLAMDPLLGTDPWPLDGATRSLIHAAGVARLVPLSLVLELSAFEDFDFTVSGELVYPRWGVSHRQLLSHSCRAMRGVSGQQRRTLADLLDPDFCGTPEQLLDSCGIPASLKVLPA